MNNSARFQYAVSGVRPYGMRVIKISAERSAAVINISNTQCFNGFASTESVSLDFFERSLHVVDGDGRA